MGASWILGTRSAVGLPDSKSHFWTSTSVWTEGSPLGLHGHNPGLGSLRTGREVVGIRAQVLDLT
jgi:hypothetical protein